jgi:hypothetical protein
MKWASELAVTPEVKVNRHRRIVFAPLDMNQL